MTSGVPPVSPQLFGKTTMCCFLRSRRTLSAEIDEAAKKIIGHRRLGLNQEFVLQVQPDAQTDRQNQQPAAAALHARVLDQRPGVDSMTAKGDPYGMPFQVRPQAGPRLVFPCWLCMWGVMLLGCSHNASHDSRTQAAFSSLNPVTQPIPLPFVRQTVYIPVYSAIDLGTDIKMNMLELAATLSVRNVSVRYPLVIESVRYYDSSGKQVREYVSTPSELKPLATAEFVITRNDTSGGPGAKFLVRWAGPPEMNEPLIEAIMVGRSANSMVSFTSPGRTLKDETQR